MTGFARKSVLSVMVAAFLVSSNAYAYEEAEIEFDAPEVVLVGEPAEIKWKVTYLGDVLLEGVYNYVGSSPGKEISVNCGSYTLPVTRYPAKGGQFEETVSGEIEYLIDVVQLLDVDPGRPDFSLVGNEREFQALVLPSEYAERVTWDAIRNATASEWTGNRISVSALDAGTAVMQATLTVNGVTRTAQGSFTGVDVKWSVTPGTNDSEQTVEATSNNNHAEYGATAPTGAINFELEPSGYSGPTTVIANIVASDITAYSLEARCGTYQTASSGWTYNFTSPSGPYTFRDIFNRDGNGPEQKSEGITITSFNKAYSVPLDSSYNIESDYKIKADVSTSRLNWTTSPMASATAHGGGSYEADCTIIEIQ